MDETEALISPDQSLKGSMKRRGRATGNLYSDGDNWRCHQLAKFLQERAASQQEVLTSQDSEIETQNQVMTLFDDLVFKILILLPAQSLLRLQFVCKKWFQIINSSIFIRCHAQQSETVLICRKLTLYEDNLKSYFHFMDLDEEGNRFIEPCSIEVYDVLASCDGLILARFGDCKNNVPFSYRVQDHQLLTPSKLMITNPITKKHIALPDIPMCVFIVESFGFVYSRVDETYKVVHLFYNRSGYSGCNILCLSTRKWKRIEGPPFEFLFNRLWEIPVTVGESLYWMKRPCSYYLSMDLQEEKFATKTFPVSCTAYWDKLLEIEGCLAFAHHARVDLLQLQVWIRMDSRENWVKRYSFSLDVAGLIYYKPICSSRNGKEIVIESSDNKLCVYNLEGDEMKIIHSRSDNEAWCGWILKTHIPHRNTLVSWI